MKYEDEFGQLVRQDGKKLGEFLSAAPMPSYFFPSRTPTSNVVHSRPWIVLAYVIDNNQWRIELNVIIIYSKARNICEVRKSFSLWRPKSFHFSQQAYIYIYMICLLIVAVFATFLVWKKKIMNVIKYHSEHWAKIEFRENYAVKRENFFTRCVCFWLVRRLQKFKLFTRKITWMKSELKQKSYSSRRTGLPTLFEVINMALGLKREIL